MLRPEVGKASAWGLAVTAVLALLILVGSRNLAHFDAALAAYTVSILFATFGLSYRYSMWLQRPPTGVYWRRGWQAFVQRGFRLRNLWVWVRRVGSEVAANRFIVRRGRLRGLTHLLIMWGCVLAAAITFPLVFGWLFFVPHENPGWYRMVVFGFPTIAFPTESVLADVLFHGLVWASLLVIPGVMLAMRRRMREKGVAAVQRYSEDLLPLILLFSVSLTGLMLVASYTWMQGYAYSFIAILHAITVIGTFIWLPFGKLFHIFQRPAQLGVSFYKDMGGRGEAARCLRCGTAFTSRMHVEDLIDVERRLGYRYDLRSTGEGAGEHPVAEERAAHAEADRVEHFQWICPPCRRASLAVAQGLAWRGRRGGGSLPVHGGAALPMPRYANRGRGEGPLGTEDEHNFHP